MIVMSQAVLQVTRADDDYPNSHEITHVGRKWALGPFISLTYSRTLWKSMCNFHSAVYQLQFLRWQYNQLLVGHCADSSDSSWWNDHKCVDICTLDDQIMSFYSVYLADFAYMFISTIPQKSFCNWCQIVEAAQYYQNSYYTRHVKAKLVRNWENHLIAWSFWTSTFRGLVIGDWQRFGISHLVYAGDNNFGRKQWCWRSEPIWWMFLIFLFGVWA